MQCKDARLVLYTPLMQNSVTVENQSQQQPVDPLYEQHISLSYTLGFWYARMSMYVMNREEEYTSVLAFIYI